MVDIPDTPESLIEEIQRLRAALSEAEEEVVKLRGYREQQSKRLEEVILTYEEAVQALAAERAARARLEGALKRCIEEIEENLEFDGPLASFKEAVRISRAALSGPSALEAVPCAHAWEPYGDSDLGDVPGLGPREEVRCSKCGVPGERYIETGEVDWPTT